VFVFRRVGERRFAHVGGVGRGAGWAGIVEIPDVELELGTLAGGARVRRRVAPVAQHFFGPYYTRAAAVVAVDHDLLVVFGSADRIGVADEELISLAHAAAAELTEVSPAKRLADELEVLTAVRALTQSPADSVEQVLAKLVDTATGALSCDLGVAYVPGLRLTICDMLGSSELDVGEARATLARLCERTPFPKCVQQSTVDDLPPPFSSADGVVAYYLLEIREPERGLLLLAHTVASPPRGFTSLCQSLGSQLVQAAEPLLQAAAVRDRMREDLDAAWKAARTDQLTGLANRLAWQEALRKTTSSVENPVALVLIDCRGLKAINDTHGHHVGDLALRTIAASLQAAVRGGDVVARLGGDEFGLLLPGCGQLETERLIGRIHAAIASAAAVRIADLGVAVGAVVDTDGDLESAQQRADTHLIAAKHDHPRA
jgi:diguanylate cyclase (GGDEF)-like protein